MSSLFSEIDRIKTFGQYCPRTVCGVSLRPACLLGLARQGFYCSNGLIVCKFCSRVIDITEYLFDELTISDVESHATSCRREGNIAAVRVEQELERILRSEQERCAQDRSLRKANSEETILVVSLRTGVREVYLNQ